MSTSLRLGLPSRFRRSSCKRPQASPGTPLSGSSAARGGGRRRLNFGTTRPECQGSAFVGGSYAAPFHGPVEPPSIWGGTVENPFDTNLELVTARLNNRLGRAHVQSLKSVRQYGLRASNVVSTIEIYRQSSQIASLMFLSSDEYTPRSSYRNTTSI
jgi:hypothetical protein